MKKTVGILLLIFLITSCDTHLRIEKRRYMKGYYVDFKKPNKLSNNQTSKVDDYILQETNTYESKSEVTLPESNEDIIIPPVITSKQSAKKNIILPAQTSIKKIGEKAITEQKLKNASHQKNKNTIAYSLLILVSVLLGWSIKKTYNSKRSNVTKLKKWSVKNKQMAFALSVIGRTLLMIIGFWSGVKLFEMNYLFPQHTLHIGIGVYALGLIVFLFRKSTYERFFSFLKAKLHSLILIVTGFVLFATIGNTVAHENANRINTDKHLNKRCARFFESKPQQSKQSFISFSKALKINMNEDDTNTTVLKVLLLLFTIISIVILQALVIILSCALMCEGNEAGGVALAFGGSIFLAALSIITIYWINRIDLGKKEVAK